MDIRKWTEEGVAGSVTAESAMLMPFVLGMVFLLLTMSISLYDRCLFEQEGIRLEVRAVSGRETDRRIEDILKEKEEDFPGEHLLLGEHSFQVETDGKKVYMKRSYHYVQPSNIVQAFEKLSVTGNATPQVSSRPHTPPGIPFGTKAVPLVFNRLSDNSQALTYSLAWLLFYL